MLTPLSITVTRRVPAGIPVKSTAVPVALFAVALFGTPTVLAPLPSKAIVIPNRLKSDRYPKL